MLTSGSQESSTRLFTLLLLAIFSSSAVLGIAHAAEVFTTATITKLENRVRFGERRAGRNITRAAAVADVLRGNNFLLSEEDSRAELQYPDGTLVRIGQNTVFSFDPATRTLELQKGSMIFNMPRGAGGGTIKTPSLTAAISGTTVKVSPTIVAVIEGSLRLIPSGRVVNAGEFARRNADGSITIAAFDRSRQNDGRLVDWDGLMPGFEERALQLPVLAFDSSSLRSLELLQRANNLPNSIGRFYAVRPRTSVRVPRDPDDGNDVTPFTPPANNPLPLPPLSY